MKEGLPVHFSPFWNGKPAFFEKVMKYILNYTLGESLEYTEENLAELKAFGYNYEIVEITPKGAELFNRTELN